MKPVPGQQRPNVERIRRSIGYSTLDGSCYALMLGLGEAQFAPFALLLFRSEELAGLVSTVPLLLGTVISLISPWAVSRLGSHKRWIVISAFAQAAAFVPLIVAALAGAIPRTGLFAAVTVYFAAAWCAGLTWNTFIAGLIHRRLRARYFGRRVLITNLASVAATALAGVILSAGQPGGMLEQSMSAGEAFALAFALAGAARLVSALLLRAQVEPVPMPPNHRHLSLAEFGRMLTTRTTGRLITYILAAQLAVQISTPFITPYLLEQAGLKSNYTVFGFMLAVQLIAKAFFMDIWGRYAHARGPHALLAAGAIIIIPQPILWMLPPTIPVLFLLQLSSGISTAAFELGIFLMLLRHVDDGLRTSIMARYQLMNSAVFVLGSLVGAAVLHEGQRLGVGYSWLFVLGGVARLITLPLFYRIRFDPGVDLAPAGEVSVELHPGSSTGDPALVVSAKEPDREAAADRSGHAGNP